MTPFKEVQEEVIREYDGQPPVSHSGACKDSPLKECNPDCPYKIVKEAILSAMQKSALAVVEMFKDIIHDEANFWLEQKPTAKRDGAMYAIASIANGIIALENELKAKE